MIHLLQDEIVFQEILTFNYIFFYNPKNQSSFLLEHKLITDTVDFGIWKNKNIIPEIKCHALLLIAYQIFIFTNNSKSSKYVNKWEN